MSTTGPISVDHHLSSQRLFTQRTLQTSPQLPQFEALKLKSTQPPGQSVSPGGQLGTEHLPDWHHSPTLQGLPHDPQCFRLSRRLTQPNPLACDLSAHHVPVNGVPM